MCVFSIQVFSHVIISLVLNPDYCAAVCTRTLVWRFCLLADGQNVVSVFTFNKMNRHSTLRADLFKPNLIQIFQCLDTFLCVCVCVSDSWSVQQRNDGISKVKCICTTGASAESAGFWFLCVLCWMLILSVFWSISLSFSHSAWVLVLQENSHFRRENVGFCSRRLDVTQRSRTAVLNWTLLQFVHVSMTRGPVRYETHWVQWILYIRWYWGVNTSPTLLSSLRLSKLSVPSRPLRLNKAAVGLNGCLAVETGLNSTAEPPQISFHCRAPCV